MAKTAFGRFLETQSIPYEDAASALDITRSYVGMLARGDVTPALDLAFKIADWAKIKGGGDDVRVESWEMHLG